MVSGQNPDASTGLPLACTGKYAGTVGAAINQIAKQDNVRLGLRLCRVVFLNCCDQGVVQVQPSVNVADHIVALAFWHGWQPCVGLSAGSEQVSQSG